MKRLKPNNSQISDSLYSTLQDKLTRGFSCSWQHVLFFVICCVMGGCASQESLLESTSFNTKITDSGLKHFEIYLADQPPESSSGKDKITLPKAGPAPSRSYKGRRSSHRLTKIAQTYMETTHFCRTGYWVMEIDLYRPIPRMRGECNEAASAEDRKKFPDSIRRW